MTPDQKANAALRAGPKAIKKYLADYDPEGFGCACVPDKWLCGPCTERERQKPLLAALRLGAAKGDGT